MYSVNCPKERGEGTSCVGCEIKKFVRPAAKHDLTVAEALELLNQGVCQSKGQTMSKPAVVPELWNDGRLHVRVRDLDHIG